MIRSLFIALLLGTGMTGALVAASDEKPPTFAQIMGSWVGDQLSHAEQNWASWVERGATGSDLYQTGSSLHDLIQHTLDTAHDGLQRFSSDMSAQSPSDIAQWDQKFQSETLPNDVQNLAMPTIVTGTINTARNLYDRVESKVDQLTTNAQRIGDNLNAAADRVRSYFSDGTNYGLEPSGTDTQAIKADLSGADGSAMADQASQHYGPGGSTSLEDLLAQSHADGGSSTLDDPATDAQRLDGVPATPGSDGSAGGGPTHARVAASSSPNSDLLGDLRAAGFDTDEPKAGSNEITADDLADLGGTASPSVSSKLDAGQIQRDFNDFDRQQEEQRRAREAERARLAAIEQQRQAEENARQLQAAQDYAARQAELAQANSSATEAGSKPAPDAHGISLWDSAAAGLQSIADILAARQRNAAPQAPAQGPDAWFNNGTAPAKKVSHGCSDAQAYGEARRCN